MPKGQKTCKNPSCQKLSGPRSYMCKYCNTPFVFKPTSKEKKNTKVIRDFNWKDLVKGDRIKVSSGPYYVHNGDFIPMGYRGKFIVEGVDETGIKAWGIGRSAGFAHIYMGRDWQNPATGVWKIKHKLFIFRSKESKVLA